jgi:two-component system, OmpR family, KDP operon response regulator KdpE
MSRPRIFIINDYTPLRDLLRINLKVRGFEVKDTASHSGLLGDIKSEQADLVILDLVLDGADGFELCRQICDYGLAAVIVINLRSGEADMLKCLEMGIDDYISKPFGVDELMARIEASLRHRKKVKVPEAVLQK